MLALSAAKGQSGRNADINVNDGHHQDSQVDLGLRNKVKHTQVGAQIELLSPMRKN